MYLGKYRPGLLLITILIMLLTVAMACGGEKAPAPAPTAAPSPAGTPTTAPATGVTPAAIERPVYGGTLRTAVPLSMKTLDPLHGVDHMEQAVYYTIYDSLVEANDKGEVVPGLARSWDISSDGKVVTFHLAKGVKFHDGIDFNAQTVKWVIEQIKNKDFAAQRGVPDIFTVVNKVDVIDDSTVAFHLDKAFRPLMGNMTLAWVRIISPAAWQKYGKDGFGKNPVGTGPFKLKEWTPDTRLILEKFDKYWEEGKPYVDSILFQNAPDESVQLAMLRTGETDVLWDMRPTQLPLLQNDPNVKVHSLNTGRWWGLVMDTTFKPWDNKALRQAVGYAINRQTLVDTYLEGYGEVDYTSGIAWYEDRSYRPYEYDPQKAKEKLREAGYPSGVTFDYWCLAAEEDLRLCELIQAMLRQSSINTNIVQVPSSDYWGNWLQEKQHFGLYRWSPRPDPDFVLRSMLHCEGSTAKFVHYCNQEASKIIDDAVGVYDPAVAGPMYIKAQQLVFDDIPYFSMMNNTQLGGLSSKVRNFWRAPGNYPQYRHMWLAK